MLRLLQNIKIWDVNVNRYIVSDASFKYVGPKYR